MTPLERIRQLEVEYLESSGWKKDENSLELPFWSKEGDQRTNGTAVPQLTAVIWQRMDDERVVAG